MKIKFSTDGAAFDECSYYEEINRILKVIAEDVRMGCDCGSIMDINGNKIGEWSL
jgi:hypothetical protein